MLRHLVYLSILTFIIIITWIAFGVYHNYITSTIESDAKILISPISGKFDVETLEKVVARKKIDADLSARKQEATATPTIVPANTSTEEATVAAQL